MKCMTLPAESKRLQTALRAIMPKAIPTPYPQEALKSPHVEEEKNVHEVYDQIAPHFSQTRFKVG